jgi:hypothetical protein
MDSNAQSPSVKKPLAPLWVGMAILAFPPFGYYLLWNHPTLRKANGWWLGGIAWGLIWSFTNVLAPRVKQQTGPEFEATAAQSTAESTERRPVKRSAWGPTVLAYKKRIDLCDNPDKYKDTEMQMEVRYGGGGLRTNGKLAVMPCTVFYGDGSFAMKFEIPDDVPQPRIEPGQYLMVTFVFSGSVDTPSTVTKLARK